MMHFNYFSNFEIKEKSTKHCFGSLLLLSESKHIAFNEHSVGVKRHKTLSSSNSRYNCEEDGDVSIEDGDGGRGGGLPEVFWEWI